VRRDALFLGLLWFFFLFLWSPGGSYESSSDSELGSDDDGSWIVSRGSFWGDGGAVFVSVGPRRISVSGARKGMLGRRMMLAWPSVLYLISALGFVLLRIHREMEEWRGSDWSMKLWMWGHVAPRVHWDRRNAGHVPVGV
jgi:hypothetical protein